MMGVSLLGCFLGRSLAISRRFRIGHPLVLIKHFFSKEAILNSEAMPAKCPMGSLAKQLQIYLVQTLSLSSHMFLSTWSHFGLYSSKSTLMPMLSG